MELSVYKIDGTLSGKKVVLDEKVFGVEPNDHVISTSQLSVRALPRPRTAVRLHIPPRSSDARRAAAVHVTAPSRLVSS